MKISLEKTFRDLVALPSPSKGEDQVSVYIQNRLKKLGVSFKTDVIGNVIGFVSGKGETILLNAHMDGVPPSLGHTPIKKADVLRSNGKTNLRADDVAGISIILEAMKTIIEGKISHPPITLVFSVQEEIGLFGAKALDISEYGVKQGIVFDNAFESGVVVSKGACYIAFDVEIKGKETHPGKDLSLGVNAVQVLLDTGIKTGEADKGKTRINIGYISAGRARNVVPGNVIVQGEIRSFLSGEKLKKKVSEIKSIFLNTGKTYGAEIVFSDKQLAVAYEISEDEPLLTRYKRVVEKRGGEFKTQETFVASDANVFRGEKGLKVFVISTGVKNEHTVEETVSLSDMEQLKDDLVTLLEQP